MVNPTEGGGLRDVACPVAATLPQRLTCSIAEAEDAQPTRRNTRLPARRWFALMRDDGLLAR